MSNATVLTTPSFSTTSNFLPTTSTPATVFITTTSFSTFTPLSSTIPTTTAVPITTPFTTSSFSSPTPSPSPSPASQGVVTSFVTEPASIGGTPTVVVVTSTQTPTEAVASDPTLTSSSTTTASSASSSASALAVSDASSASGGLSPTGKTAVAVVVPVAVVALIILALIFFFRRRKQRKNEEELRRKEVEEYGFNPNNDPTLPAVGVANSGGDEVSEMRETDGAGYRGWGTAPSNRKASTTMSSGNGAIGMARSDSGSQPSPYMPASPTATTAVNSDVHSGDPLVNSRPLSTDSETIGALGAAPAAMGNRQDRGINRGPSNASSAYSGANRSDNSGDASLPHAMSSPQYYNEGVNYDEGIPQHGPYGDGSYGGAQPVIRDVQARRNTRIENPKFGKHLQKRQLDIPEYAARFVNYKALKKLIKQLSATPTLLARNASHHHSEILDPETSLQANKATFFFRLERELERVNAFYLQKEAELKLRLKTLLDKKRVMQSKSATASKVSASFVTLEEGFQQFGNDLNKLQQFVEVNATAFSKILKKWDKTSKSRTKELYLSRAVEVQPCFNRDIISDLSDQATTSLLELGAWAEGEKIDYEPGKPAGHAISGQTVGAEEDDADSQLLQATNSGNLVALREWIARLKSSSDAKSRFTRIFLSAITEAPVEALDVLLETDLVDIHAEDEINERNCLHEAAISGREPVLDIGIARGIDVTREDVYGRKPLHYASMHGNVAMIHKLLQYGPQTIDSLDHDNFTPLIHGIVHHQLECVEQLLAHGARIDPDGESDHVPLNLACQHGSTAIIELLLSENARIMPDAEGLYPQHLVARTGQTPDTLLMLERYGADLNQQDRLYQWTPLFHAASEGCVECMRTLLDRGVDVDVLDEKDLSAMYYAAWEGHLECMKLLSSTSSGHGLARASLATGQRKVAPKAVTAASGPMSVDADGIPDLSLPPPIIPLRRYGHNFLDSKTFIQISFEEAGSDAIVFYHDSKYPAARLTISSKLSDLIPRNVMLPIQEDFKIISFQIDNLDSFAVDFDIFPTFGSKVIAKSVALPNVFTAIASSSGHVCLPLFDPRLRAIGQISFNFQVIKPFDGAPLEITQFATYWKATSHFDTHPTALITGSSLSGDYVQIFVQLTSDGIPVLYPQWSIDHHGISFPISRLSKHQFLSLGSQEQQETMVLPQLRHKTVDDITEVHRILSTSFTTLEGVLANLPTSIHVDLHILYPSVAEEHVLGLGPSANINNFADIILQDVFEHARLTREITADFMRSIVFTSYHAGICTALNWKQPNYPVLLCNDLGAKQDTSRSSSTVVESSGRGSMSVKEAVHIAQSNNFMGLVCSSRLLNMVPALIDFIKVAGLVLVTTEADEVASSEQSASSPRSERVPEGVNGVLQGNGILRFNETIDM
ncbi:phosphate system positive regulatory protein pho81 [Lambiella insularis]|nr:phosphate system positive regulatory protein pho81 [Lambiella insularis]